MRRVFLFFWFLDSSYETTTAYPNSRKNFIFFRGNCPKWICKTSDVKSCSLSRCCFSPFCSLAAQDWIGGSVQFRIVVHSAGVNLLVTFWSFDESKEIGGSERLECYQSSVYCLFVFVFWHVSFVWFSPSGYPFCDRKGSSGTLGSWSQLAPTTGQSPQGDCSNQLAARSSWRAFACTEIPEPELTILNPRWGRRVYGQLTLY
jgi:hypothetical protein